MKAFVVSLLVLFSGVAQAQPKIAVLKAEFQGRSAVNGHVFTIEQSSSKKWTVSEFTGCPSFPCSPADYTLKTVVTPLMISNSFADGNTEIKLNDEMTVIYVNNGMAAPREDGSRVESYWKLELKKRDAAPEDIMLTLTGFVQ